MTDWRKIEMMMTDFAKIEGAERLYRNASSDWCAEHLNLSKLARYLADELKNNTAGAKP